MHCVASVTLAASITSARPHRQYENVPDGMENCTHARATLAGMRYTAAQGTVQRGKAHERSGIW